MSERKQIIVDAAGSSWTPSIEAHIRDAVFRSDDEDVEVLVRRVSNRKPHIRTPAEWAAWAITRHENAADNDSMYLPADIEHRIEVAVSEAVDDALRRTGQVREVPAKYWHIAVDSDGLIVLHGDTEALSGHRKEIAEWLVETINDAGDKLHKRGKYAEAA